MSRKKINQNNSDIYGELVDFQDRLHAQNLKRIHIGMLCVLIIPMIFLALMLSLIHICSYTAQSLPSPF